MRTKGPLPSKVKAVEEASALLDKSQAAFLTEYRGLTVSEITELRDRLRKSGGEYHVFKNTLVRRAMGDRLTDEISEQLNGPTAIAFAGDDPIATAKVLADFFRDVKKPDVVVKGGFMEGAFLSSAQCTALAKLPGRDTIRAQAVGTLQAPLNNFAGTMQGVLSEFARTLQALADKLQAEAA